MARPFNSLSLSLGNASALARIKEAYLMWVGISSHIPKSAKYTIGARIENKFLDLLEQAYSAYFSEKEKKGKLLAQCIFTSDILKFLITTCWEGKFISHKHYEDISIKSDEIGKMLWGWKKNINFSKKKNPEESGKR